jgi:L-amino acid N-acyltransferase YncA
VVCKIVHQPFENKISISFHEKFGFKKISEIAEKDYVAGIYLKNF